MVLFIGLTLIAYFPQVYLHVNVHEKFGRLHNKLTTS